jgi:hypothetical protein
MKKFSLAHNSNCANTQCRSEVSGNGVFGTTSMKETEEKSWHDDAGVTGIFHHHRK